MISFRVTLEEYARLEVAAAGLALSDHLRVTLFDEAAEPRQTRGRFPVKDHAALAKIAGLQGRNAVYSSLSQIAKASNSGLISLTPEQNIVLLEGCADQREIRSLLMTALGKYGGKTGGDS